ncbi:MAG: hypothetical protein ABIN68_03675 [Sphingomicrobium sp.]
MRAWPVLIAVAAGLSGCASMALTPTNASGTWGGPHIGLILEGGLGRLEYDCASGTVDSPVIPAADGSFTATGTHRPGQGGPIRVGQIFTSVRATYAGTIVKDHITLGVVLEDGTALGPFSLDRGVPAQLTRCL